MTVLALSDLALWSTIDPIVRERRLESISWRDIHPGRRFLQCVDQLKKVGLMEDEHQYGEFSNALCRNLGWPRIEDLLRIALELRAKTDNPVLESFLACCELRKQIPWAFAFSAHEPALSTLMSKCPPAVAGRDDAHIAPVGMPGKRGLILLIAHDAAWLSRHAAFGSDLALEGLFFMGLPGEDEDRDGLLRQMIKDHLFFGMHDLIFDRNR